MTPGLDPATGPEPAPTAPLPLADGVLVIVMTTCPITDAARLAEGLVTARLAACVQRLAIDSTYRWQGTVESAPETLLLCKTARPRVPALRAWLDQHHPYELPEIVAVEALPPPLTAPAYADWVRAETAPCPVPPPSDLPP